MWATEALQSCKSLVTNAADIWERFIWSENVWSEDFQPANDQEPPDIHNEAPDCESVYEAHPLDQPNTIRVLKILPSTSLDMTDDISCCLNVISLDPPFFSLEPPFFSWAQEFFEIDIPVDYRAVSYVWGSPSVTKAILIDGKQFVVRANLWDFLAEARRENFTGALWVDAICINQNNMEERSSQVAMMGLIYSKAINVWAWVGLGTKRHHSAFQHIAKIDWPAEVQKIVNGQESSAIKQHIKSLNLLLDLEYWSRLWIIQEYVLARCVTIQCGPEVLSEITLDHIAKAVEGLGRITSKSYKNCLYHSAGARVLNLRICHTDQLLKFMSAGPYLCYLIIESHSGRASCSDPHDHVYALLSLHSIARSEIVPDYEKPLLQLFFEVVSFLDRKSGWNHKKIRIMTRTMKMMQEKLSLNDCAEATQARLRVTDRLESIRSSYG